MTFTFISAGVVLSFILLQIIGNEREQLRRTLEAEAAAKAAEAAAEAAAAAAIEMLMARSSAALRSKAPAKPPVAVVPPSRKAA